MAYKLLCLHLAAAETPLMNNRQIAPKMRGVTGRYFDVAHVRGNNREILNFFVAEILAQNKLTRQMVHRYIEEPLQLLGVQINSEDTVCAGGGNDVGDKFRRNRHPAFVLAVLAGIAKVRDNRGNSICACAFQAIKINQQLDEVFVNGTARGLNHETIPAAHVVFDADDFFAIGKLLYFGSPKGHFEVIAHRLCQRLIAAAGKHLYMVIQKHLSLLIPGARCLFPGARHSSTRLRV